MLRDTLVVIHATSGIVGLVAGLFALAPPRSNDQRSWLRGAYTISVAILVVSLVVLVVTDWRGLEAGARIAFGALTGLAAVMIYRLARAGREASIRGTNWQDRYIGHLYFSYISLWEGFVILPALNLPLPQVSVPALAVAVLLVGHTLLSRYKRRLVAT